MNAYNNGCANCGCDDCPGANVPGNLAEQLSLLLRDCSGSAINVITQRLATCADLAALALNDLRVMSAGYNATNKSLVLSVGNPGNPNLSTFTIDLSDLEEAFGAPSISQDACNTLRLGNDGGLYAPSPSVNPIVLATAPTPTGNTTNLNQFVYGPNGETYYIDACGNAILVDRNALPPLPSPKLSSVAKNHVGLDHTLLPIDCGQTMVINIAGMPDIYLKDASFDLGLELVRRKTRARRHFTRNSRQGIVHPVHRVGGVSAPVLLGNLGGIHNGAPNGNKPSEWSLVGMQHNATIPLDVGVVFAPWFRHVSVADFVTGFMGPKAYAYLDGRVEQRWGLLGTEGVTSHSYTGVFWFRYSVYDARTRKRIHGPLSPAIVVRQERSATTAAWRVGDISARPFRRHSPLFLTRGPGRLLARIHAHALNTF